MSKQRLAELFEEIDRTPWGPTEVALVAEAVALAQELGDEQLEYQARMRQTASAHQAGDTEKALTSFAWCLAKYDEDPQRFPASASDDGSDVLWQFKWMAGLLACSPAFGRDQIMAVLDDMEAHYQAAGLGKSGVLMSRFEEAWRAGRFDEADALRTLVVTTPRDSHSHCEACGPSQLAGYAIDRGDDVEALRQVQLLVDGEFTCGEEPERALATAMLPYLRQGRPDDARAAHLQSYRYAKSNANNLGIIADHIIFCAVTGNEARALPLIERHLEWLGHDGLDSHAHFSALCALGLGLDAVTNAGHGDTIVRGADAASLVQFFGPHDGGWTASDLAVVAWQAASVIAVQFDERNGTSAYADRIAHTHSIAAQRFDLPLHTDAFGPAATAVAANTAADRVQRAVDLNEIGATEAGPAARDARVEADPTTRAKLLSITLGWYVTSDEESESEANALLAERITALRESGNLEQAELEERVGMVMFGLEDEATAATLDRELASHRSNEVRADLEITRSNLYLRAGDYASARRLAEAALARAGSADLRGTALQQLVLIASQQSDPAATETAIEAALSNPLQGKGDRAWVLSMRARFRGSQGQFAEAAADADAAYITAVMIGAHSQARDFGLLAAALHEDAGALLEAISRYRRAASDAETAGISSINVRYRLGRALLTAGAPEEAIDTLMDVLSDETEAEAPAESRGDTMMMLARAFEGAEEYGRAAGAWAYAAELFEEGEAPARRASALIYRGKLLNRFGEHDDAAADLATALEVSREHDDDPYLLIDALHTLAQARGAQRDASVYGLLDEAKRQAQAHDADWVVADITDSRARALAIDERPDEAVATALQAADLYAEAGDPASAGASELFVARLLADADRLTDAVPVLQSAVEHAADAPALRSAIALDLGNILESLGRFSEATQARALAES